MDVKLYTTAGKEKGSVSIDPLVFSVTPKPALLWEAVRAQQSKRRRPYAHTKTKGEVRGGGKKPWKQKGTGRARHGSTRNPQWKGGGVAFGPRNERNYDIKINAKAYNLALRMALSDRAMNQQLVVMEGLDGLTAKTKSVTEVIRQLPIETKKKTLIITGEKTKLLARMTRNLKGCKTIWAASLNVVEVLDSTLVIVADDALETVTTTYKPKKSTTTA
jgi:large subunit ribosomal protein L4